MLHESLRGELSELVLLRMRDAILASDLSYEDFVGVKQGSGFTITHSTIRAEFYFTRRQEGVWVNQHVDDGTEDLRYLKFRNQKDILDPWRAWLNRIALFTNELRSLRKPLLTEIEERAEIESIKIESLIEGDGSDDIILVREDHRFSASIAFSTASKISYDFGDPPTTFRAANASKEELFSYLDKWVGHLRPASPNNPALEPAPIKAAIASTKVRRMGYNLTHAQKDYLKWLVDEVRGGKLAEEEIWHLWTMDGSSIGQDLHNKKEVSKSTLKQLEREELVVLQHVSKNHINVTVLQKGFDAVDASFDESQSTQIKKTPHMKVFISHSSRDAELAKALVELLRSAFSLRAREIRCTSVDGYRLQGGDDFNEVLRNEAVKATAFIGLLTPSSIRSAYVLFELGARWGSGHRFIPILAKGARPDEIGGPLPHCVDGGSEAQVHDLLELLEKEFGERRDKSSAYVNQLRSFRDLASQSEETEAVPDAAMPSEHEQRADRILLAELTSILTNDRPFSFLREHSFGNSFDSRHLDPLIQFSTRCKHGDFEFQIAKLEECRSALCENVGQFLAATGLHTRPDRGGWQRVPKEWIGEEPERWNSVVNQLNDTADEIVKQYDLLRKKARLLLGVG